MRLSDIAVRRPVAAAVLSLLIVAFGALSFLQLPLREYPNIDVPIVSVDVTYTGAAAAVIESRITQVIEDRLSGIEGVKAITSSSRDGRSDISIEFDINRDIDDAANDVRDRVSGVLDNLPEEADPPEVSKVDADAQPIMFVGFFSSKHNQLELTDYADRYIVDRFSALSGVAQVRIFGQARPSMRVWLDRQRLTAFGMTTVDVEAALRRQNVELPAGRIESRDVNLTVRVARPYTTPEEFAQLVIGRGTNGYLVRLGDVGRVEVSAENPYTGFRGNGQAMVGLGIVRQSNANTVAVAHAVRALIPEVNRTLPEGMEISVNFDSSVFIDESIKKVYHTLAEAAVLVVVVIFLFLGSVRATLMPALAVPISLVGAFIVLAALGYSINLLTLLALVLAIGLVVDDAIVVLENVYHRIENGETPLVASFRGAGQVSFAVIASTLVVIAVFVPVIFIGGNTGRLFRELAATMIGAVGVSLIVSLTLTPMMCSKILSSQRRPSRLNQWVDGAMTRLGASYRRRLGLLLERFWIVVAAAVGILVLTVAGLALLKGELVPEEDTGLVFINATGPEGLGYDKLLADMLEVESRLMPMTGTDGPVHRLVIRTPGNFGNTADFSTGGGTLALKHWNERDQTTKEVIEEIKQRLNDMPGMRTNANQRSSLGGRGRPVQFVIGGSSFSDLAQARDAIMLAAESYPGLVGLDADYRETKPQLLIDIDTTRAADLGVSVTAIGETLQTMMGSRKVSTYTDRGEEYDVLVQAQRGDRLSVRDLSNTYVRSLTTNELIPLSNLVRMRETADAGTLGRYNKLRAITLEANVAPGYSLGEVLDFLEAEALKQPAVAAVGYKGESRDYRESGSSLTFALILAIVVIYLVLAAQFESFIHPVTIILTVPLAIGGAVLGLHLMGATLNIYSQIGIIMLVGLATKNGILIVEFANQLRDAGRTVTEAIQEAAERRLRPILMTSIATVAGALPLMLAGGAGAASRQAIGIVIVWGVSIATVLTLFLVPVFYRRLAPFTRSPDAVSRDLDGQLGHQEAAPAE